MTDEAYTLSQTNRERKSAAHGAFAKRTGSKSKRCTLPSDHLTPAQLKRRNSTVTSYNTSKPMNSYELRKLSPAAQEYYLEAIITKYHPRSIDLAAMLDIDPNGITKLFKKYPKLKELMLPGRPKSARPEWLSFIGSTDTPESEATAVTMDPIETPIPAPIHDAPFTITSGSITLTTTANQLQATLSKLLDAVKVYTFTVNFETKEG